VWPRPRPAARAAARRRRGDAACGAAAGGGPARHSFLAGAVPWRVALPACPRTLRDWQPASRCLGSLPNATRPDPRPAPPRPRARRPRPAARAGANDTMAPRADVDKLLATWGGKLLLSRVYPRYSHMDFVWARYPLAKHDIVDALRAAR
jgi:hypothetical protein